MQQKGSFSTPAKLLDDAAYWPRRGRWDCTARAKSGIYDCLVFNRV